MDVSVELTLMPLSDNFEQPIKDFIKRLRQSPFVVMENPLSTQVYGEYKAVMNFLSAEIEIAFADQDHIVVNLKMVKSDRSGYEPNF